MAIAGRVAIVPKGEYVEGRSYERLDLVRYNDSAFVAKIANINVVPTDGDTWMMITTNGSTGLENRVSNLESSVQKMSEETSAVTYDQILKSGIKIGTITINKENYELYVPECVTYSFENTGNILNVTSSDGKTSFSYSPSGFAELDDNGKVPSSQLPSYVDDVEEYAFKSDFPKPGETGKIYIDVSTNLTYRWSGTSYVEISPSIALGTTSSTAYRGDYGEAAYQHAVTNKGKAFTSGLYKITTNDEGHVIDGVEVTKSDITDLGIPGENTNTTYTLVQDKTDGHKITFTPSTGKATVITIPDNNTTYSNMKGATSTANGSIGLVPAPLIANRAQFLRGDGSWATPAKALTTTEIDAML